MYHKLGMPRGFGLTGTSVSSRCSNSSPAGSSRRCFRNASTAGNSTAGLTNNTGLICRRVRMISCAVPTL